METPVIKLEHSDARGEVYSITLPDGQELMLLHSKKGTLRGGHAHAVPEQVMILSGRMAYHKTLASDPAMTSYLVLGPGECSFNVPGRIHMGEFLEDTWLIEYKIGAGKEEWKNDVDYQPWRERVKANAANIPANV